MKKMFALMLAAMMLLAMMPAAMAYTAVTPDNNKPTIPHTMKLTQSNVLDYTITYKFTVGDVVVLQPTFANASLAVNSEKPAIAPLVYSPSDTFDNRSCTKNLSIDWSKVKFYEPGVYRWPVKKSVHISEDAKETVSNASEDTYLYVYVSDNNGNLSVESVILSASSNPDTFKNNEDGTPSKNKNNGMEDQYPATTLDLTIKKNVTGNQGSKDQYFKFTVSLAIPGGAVDKSYNIEGLTPSVPETAYHVSKTNLNTITTSNGFGSVELWIKDGQTIVIKDLIYGTSYSITESENTGYEVTSAIGGDTADATANGANASDTGLTNSATVTFTNHKDTPVPTGIELETAAPIVGMILAMAMLALLFVGKRKEEIA